MRFRTLTLALLFAGSLSLSAHADETCNSPYVTSLIKGQEDYVHVWTLGVKGLGDGRDKLVTIDANPKSKQYGKVIHKISLVGRGEAHHMGFSDDRRYLWAGRLDDNKIFVFDMLKPQHPKLVRTISNLAAKTGFVGPHTFYAMPGRMLVQALSNTKDHGGATGMVLFNNKGDIVEKIPMPTGEIGGVKGDGYGYDIGINPAKNMMLTSSFTGWNNYMMDLGKLVKDGEAMKRFGSTMVAWDVKAMKPQQVFNVPGRAAGDPLVAQGRRQLGHHRRGADLQAVAGQAGRRRPVAGQGGGDHRRPGEDPAAGGHQHHRRRQGAVGEHLHGRHDALLRPQQPRGAEADLCQADRQAGQHGLAELGRQARLHHLVAAGQLGQEGRRQRAGAARLRLGRQGAGADASRSTSTSSSSAARTT